MAKLKWEDCIDLLVNGSDGEICGEWSEFCDKMREYRDTGAINGWFLRPDRLRG